MKIIAVQGDRKLVETGVNERGLPTGVIVDGMGRTSPEKALIVYLAHGYWTPYEENPLMAKMNDAYLKIEEKIRRVRNAAYWGAPVGTPIEPGMKPAQQVDISPRIDTPDIPEAPPVGDDEIRSTYHEYIRDEIGIADPRRADQDDYLAPALKDHVSAQIAEEFADVDPMEIFMAIFTEEQMTQPEHGGMSAWQRWRRYSSAANFILHKDTGSSKKPYDEHLNIVYRNGQIFFWTDSDLEYERAHATASDDRYDQQDGDIWARPGSPEEQEVIRRYACSQLVAMWATTSNDSHPQALAIQETARRIFELDEAAEWKMDAAKSTEVQDQLDQHGPIYERFLRAQYDLTQKFFADRGISHVRLYRGYATQQGDGKGNITTLTEPGVTTDVVTRPLSSWSTRQRTARNFLGWGGIVLSSDVPVSRLLSTPLTGVGCWGEQEMVLIGGKDTSLAPYDQQMQVEGDQTVEVSIKVDQPRPTVVIDDSDLNADWIKVLRWDLSTNPDDFTPKQLVAMLDLPVGQAMPPAIRIQAIEDAANMSIK